MSACTKWATSTVTTCKNWGANVRSTCSQWADEGSEQCSQWADDGSEQCSQWADEGSNQCSQWADEGSDQCSDWEECHWYTPWNCIAGFFCNAWYWVANWVCQAWYWVANWVCQAWYWVANWVCQAWYWVAKWVCIGFTWLVTVVCVLFATVVTVVCVAWGTLVCAVRGVAGAVAGAFGRKERTPPIERVFVLMLENRSFDHIFGFSNLSGTGIDGLPTTADGVDPATDVNRDSTTGMTTAVSTPADFALAQVQVTPGSPDERFTDPPHEFHDTMISLCGEDVALHQWQFGQPYPASQIDNGGFIDNYRIGGTEATPAPSPEPDRIMRCFGPDQLPVLNALAQEFAVCDAWFSSLPGPTWPNRFFLVAASSGGLDGSPSSWDIFTGTTVDGYRFANGTVFDSLDDRCIDWRIFEGDDFPVSIAISGMTLNDLKGRFTSFDDFAGEVSKTSFGPKFVFIEPRYGSHEFDALGPGDFTCGNSMHALDDVTSGEALVKSVYEAIRNSPHWEKSVLLVVFDEHGGFYDHVKPPPGVPPGDVITENYRQNGFLFDQLGVRVPALVISPLIPRGTIDHTVYDHTSMLATVEKLFRLPHLTDRDQAANDFLHLFSLSQARDDTPATLPSPATNPDPLPCSDDEAKPRDQSQDELLSRRSELRQAQRTGLYAARPVADLELTPSQVGFTQVALLKILQTARPPERERWIEQYKSISTGVDAALFMTEARLKLQHGLDMKRYST